MEVMKVVFLDKVVIGFVIFGGNIRDFLILDFFEEVK